MAKDNKEKEQKNPLLKGLRNLSNATKTTNTITTGLNTNLSSLENDSLDFKLSELSSLSDSDKSVINSYVFKSKMNKALLKDINSNKNKSLYDFINTEDILASVDSMVGTENTKFSQLLKDYEIVKRCIPQIHKVITSIKNNIISPDCMADSAIGIKLPSSVDEDDKNEIHSLIEKYELNQKLSDYVMDYLIAGVHYSIVIPYSAIPDMLAASSTIETSGKMNLNEAVDIIKNTTKNETVLQRVSPARNTLNESTITIELGKKESNEDYIEDPTDYEVRSNNVLTIDSDRLDSAINETLNNIEFIDGGFEYFKKAFLNEAAAETGMNTNKSIKFVVDNLREKSRIVHSREEKDKGLIDDKRIKEIRKKVDFKGCHIEELNAARVIPFKLRDTLIGYYYVEDIPAAESRIENNMLSTIMDKLNSSVYLKNDKENKSNQVENAIIKKISEKLLEAINAKFINDNYDDMDIIYQFVRVNELWKKKKRVVFFHPDDICEFRRADGSIMKNCMFLAKLYILTMLSNILANVTRGSDRNVYYVKTGLTTDIEGHVNSALRALKQNQIRYSDMGTVNEVFNIVGSNVDAFMPVSADGDKPIEIETISGQNVDMNNDFLNSLLKSIVQSFGVPSSIIDDFENIDFAKSITASNIDMAKMILDAQKEIEKPLTKMIRLLIAYEMPDFPLINEVYATLTPPSTIIRQMNQEKIGSTLEMIGSLSELLIAPEDETIQAKRLRLFRIEYLRRTIPTIDWTAIDDIIKVINHSSKEEVLENELEAGESNDVENEV